MNDYPYSLGPSVGQRAKLGAVILQSDETLEHDMRHIIPADDVALYITRVKSAPTVSQETLGQMERDLPDAVNLFPPVEFDAVAYGCTSGSSVIGVGRIDQLIKSHCHAAKTTNPVSALIAACETLGLAELNFLSPYVENVSAHLRQTLGDAGIGTETFANFNEDNEQAVARIDRASVVAAAVALHAKNPGHAIFMSCTNLQTLSAIPEIETRCGVPVLSSNLCLSWHLTKLANIPPLQNISSMLLKSA